MQLSNATQLKAVVNLTEPFPFFGENETVLYVSQLSKKSLTYLTIP